MNVVKLCQLQKMPTTALLTAGIPTRLVFLGTPSTARRRRSVSTPIVKVSIAR